MNRRQPQGVPKGGYGSLACAPLRRRSRSRSRSPRSSASSSSEMSKSRSTRSSRERARRRRRRRRRRSRSESSSSSDSSSSSSGSRESSRRRNTIPSASRLQPPRGMPIAPPHFGKHGNSMLGMGGGMGMMGMGMGMGGVPVGGMGPGGIGMVGGGGGGNVGGRKDYAAMASVAAPPPSARDPFTVRGPPMGGRGYALHSNVSLGSRPVASSSGGGKNYANFAHAGPIGSRVGVGGGGSSGGGSGGDRDRDRRSGGSYADQARDVRNAGRMLGAALSGGLPRSGGGGGRFDRGVNAPPSPPGRDQFGREREWRGNGPNVRRAPASASNGQPPVVHGSGFGTFSMASSISMGSNGGGPLQTAAATALRPQPSLTRDSRSPVGGAPMSSSALGSSSAPLTRADLVRQHSLRERRQRQMAHRASLSSSPPSALAAVAAAAASSSSSSSSSSTSSCPPEEGRYRGEKEERKGQDGEDKKRRSSSEHQDKDNGRIRTERCSPVDDRNRRDAQFRGHHQQQESKGGVDDKSKDRSRDAIASAGTSAAAGTNLGKRSALYDRSMSPCLADGNGSGRSGAPQPTVGDNSCAASTRHGKGNGDDGSGSNRNSAGAAGSGSRANTLGGVAPRLELPKGDDPGGGGGSNGKSPSRREAANHSGAANGGFPEAREGGHRAPGGHIRSDAIPHGHEHGNGQGLFAGGDALLPNEDDAPSCGEAGGSEDDGEIGRDERRREHERERGAGWKSDGFREGGGDFRRLSAGGGSGSGGEIPGVRGFIRERDRPDSPRDRGRYNPTPLQPPPMIAPDDQQGTGTLSAAARRASIAFHQIGRNDWQDKGVGKAGISGGGRPGEGHKRPRSPQLLGKGLHSACPRSSPSRHQDLRNQDSRGAGAYHPDANSNRSANHASNRHGREGRSSGPAELRHASEGTYHSRHQPPPLLPAAPDGPGSCPQHHQSRHGHRHNPNNSVGAGAATGPRSGRSSSHSAIQSERGVSRVGSNARTSPVPGHGKTSGRNSPLSRHGSPLQPGHGAGAQDSPVPGNSTEAGDVAAGGSSGGLGETNGWAPGRRLRGPVITDRLVSLKAEFLELHDMLLESDFQWEQSQKFCEVLKVQLDELMLAPHRNRDPSAQPPAR